MTDAQKARERALEEAVSRAVRDNLPPLQRTLDDLQQSFADLVSACSSARPTNALPSMLRAQTTAAALTASLAVLSSFIANAMQRRDRELSGEEAPEDARVAGVAVAEAAAPMPAPIAEEEEQEVQGEPQEKIASVDEPVAAGAAPPQEEGIAAEEETATVFVEPEPATEEAPLDVAVAEPEAAAFDVAALPKDEQELHKRANRVAKVSMQDIKMLRPEDVVKGREHKDICVRLRSELDKARKEYDRRFQKIVDHPVDYFHHWMVEILAEGDPEALGEYPYPSPVVHR